MNIKILAFGVAKELLGGASIGMFMEEDVSANTLKDKLELLYPRLKELKSFMIAVNGEYAAPGILINQGDEIAIIPPVSGG